MINAKTYTEEYVLLNGIYQYLLHYPSTSHKEVILHLHGGPGSSAANFTHALSPHWDFSNVVYYDQRGAGRTQKKNKSKPEDLTSETLIADLKETIIYIKQKYETDRVILMGQSWGTILGTQYALKYPEDIACYIGTGHCVDTRREMKIIYDKLKESIEIKGHKSDTNKIIKLQNLPYMKVEDKNYVASEARFFFLRTKYGLTLKTGSLLKLLFKSPIFKISDLLLMIKAPKTNINLMKWQTDYSVWDITEYSVPVFYLLGTDDWQTPSTLAAEYFEKINAPQKKLYWIKNAGHATDVDNPADFYEAVKEIITQL
ncbi:MAG: alpha/beta fold hydrolase [Defluviitaleaceae bacterium]|nr:alpha/beta fold hydrolase [Defluviitaleaceae bacterium]